MKVLALVGTGIVTVAHLTEEAKGYISSCDEVLYLVNEPLLEEYIRRLSKFSESLGTIYFKSSSRENAYATIAQHIQDKIKKINSLCVVIYGHPCFFATPGLLAVNRLDKEIKTIICPAISAQDCLYADLRFDPANGGSQTFDATEYILHDKLIDVSSHLIIYQIGMVGNLGLPTSEINTKAIDFLKKKLINVYGKDKKVIIYEAAIYPNTKPKIIECDLIYLDQQKITTLSTLYIPPHDVQRLPNVYALKLLK